MGSDTMETGASRITQPGYLAQPGYSVRGAKGFGLISMLPGLIKLYILFHYEKPEAKFQPRVHAED